MKKGLRHFTLAALIPLMAWGCNPKQTIEEQEGMNQPYRYLALGDSYTIGEGVAEAERFPSQVVAMLAEQGIMMEEPKIIATTGWTTDELKAGIEKAGIGGQTYEMVTLLVGVNNQYRGRDLDNYRQEFNELLEQAIEFAGGNQQRVVVLSIPDWGVTPFAVEKEADQSKVAQEIDAYNKAKQEITEQKGVKYIDITEDYRQRGHLAEGVVADKLHPSGLIYRYWAEKVAEHYVTVLK